MTEKKKVLVIDDERDFAVFIQAALQDNGFEARTVGNGEEASEVLEEYDPDLITLDLMMPGKSGIKFYRELKKRPRGKDLPVIIVTGVDRDSAGVISFRDFLRGKNVPPPEAYLEKPIDPETLIETVRRVIGES